MTVICVATFAMAACSLPVTIPLGPMAGSDDPEFVTGSTDAAVETVEEQGMVERLGAQAWAAVRGALVSAAERGEDGQAFSWKSDNAGVEGTVTTVNAFFDESGAVCRRLAITAIAYSRTENLLAEACRKDGGGWNVRPSRDTVR